MPQSICFKGYKVSCFAAKVDPGRWKDWYLIEKDNEFVRNWGFVVPLRSIRAAEVAAVIHGTRAVEEWIPNA